MNRAEFLEELHRAIQETYYKIQEEKHQQILTLLPELLPELEVARNGETVLVARQQLTLAERKQLSDSIGDGIKFQLAQVCELLLLKTAFDLETIAWFSTSGDRGDVH